MSVSIILLPKVEVKKHKSNYKLNLLKIEQIELELSSYKDTWAHLRGPQAQPTSLVE